MEPDPTRPSRWAPKVFSRRVFLRTGGATVAAAGVASTLSGCGSDEAEAQLPIEGGESYPAVPPTPDHAPDASVRQFFTATEAAAMDALIGRLVPGDAADPGARECGALDYIDHKLAAFDGGFAQGIYHEAPFAEGGDGGQARPDEIGASDQAARYGYQSAFNYREIIRTGLAALDAVARQRHGVPFAEAAPADQDAIIDGLAKGDLEGFDPPGAGTFFGTVHQHVIEGMFCDPVYGGNRGLAGWQLVGYPGAQRGYTPEYLAGEVPELEPQSITDLPHFHPGRHRRGGAAVVSGSADGNEHGRY